MDVPAKLLARYHPATDVSEAVVDLFAFVALQFVGAHERKHPKELVLAYGLALQPR